ncbi:MAG: putative lipid II flippase FtsW [Clostridia bacterium]|nr:putative lipid II flippase FtsW [Clostridia bacterium]
MKFVGLRVGNKRWKVDFVLLFAVLFLVAFGVLMVYSASFYSAGLTYNDPYFFMKKQLFGAILGFVGLVAMYFIDYQKLAKLKWIGLGISVVLLALVFVPGLGVKVYGATRWINLGVTTIQPSEIAKFGFVLFASCSLCEAKRKVKSFKGVLPSILAGGLICCLIILEPNMSITICTGVSLVAMLFVGGARFKDFCKLAIPVIVLIPLLIIAEPYRLRRLVAFADPFASASGEGFQLVQSLYALSSGGLTGVGLFNSRQKYLFLPFAESDFIFSIIAEEFGFVGSVGLVLVFGIVIVRGIMIAVKSTTRFGCYLATGITTIIAVQFVLNLCVCSGLVPPTGLPLPFISAGSTSLVVFMSAVGVLLNIDRQTRKTKI